MKATIKAAGNMTDAELKQHVEESHPEHGVYGLKSHARFHRNDQTGHEHAEPERVRPGSEGGKLPGP